MNCQIVFVEIGLLAFLQWQALELFGLNLKLLNQLKRWIANFGSQAQLKCFVVHCFQASLVKLWENLQSWNQAVMLQLNYLNQKLWRLNLKGLKFAGNHQKSLQCLRHWKPIR